MFTGIDKAIVAGIALFVAIANGLGWEIPGSVQDALAEVLIFFGGFLGVWWIRNKGTTPTADENETGVRSTAAAGLGALLLALVVLSVSSCGWMDLGRPKIDNVSDAIAVTSADIESLATQVQSLCGNEVPGGPCQDWALISTDTKDDWRDRLQEAQNANVLANRALDANNAADADDRLARAEAILRLLRSELSRYTGPEDE